MIKEFLGCHFCQEFSLFATKSPRHGNFVVVLPRYDENRTPARKGKTLTEDAFEHSAAKMRDNGMTDMAIAQFKRLYEVWRSEEASTWIREDDVEPLVGVPSFHDVYETINHDKAVDAFAKTAFLKLNGGLGTSMGLDCAKSLLPVRRHKARQMRFIDIIIGQVLTARTRLGVELPLTLMNSFRTSNDTMKVLRANKKFHQEDIPLEIVQHQEPKIGAETGLPVSFPANPELEWCPPGHGDLFSTIWESGLLDVLEEKGFKSCSSRIPTISAHVLRARWRSTSKIRCAIHDRGRKTYSS